MIHKDLCDAKYTTYWSPLRMQLHFLFATVHTWDGEIPLTIHEMKNMLNCHIDTLKKLLNEAEYEEIISRKEGKIYFNKCVFDDRQPYVKNFPFLHSEEFRREDVRVIRFVLHMLAMGVYSRKQVFNNSLKNLYHQESRIHQGLFNIYSAAELKKVIEKAKKYLVFANTESRIVRVVDLKSEYHAPAVKNQGEYIFIKNYLNEYGLGDVSDEKISEIIKVNSRYLKGLGVMAKEFIKEVLFHILSVLDGKSNLVNLLLSGEAREVGLYYSKVCEEYEQIFAGLLSKRIENIENASETSKSVIGTCRKWFIEKIEEERKKISQFIQRWEDYWLEIIKKKSQSKDYIITKFQGNPLFDHLDKVQLALRTIHKQSKDKLKPVDFTFYNWLEN